MPDLTNDMTPEPRRPCIACGGPHGSINERILCLENAVTILRGERRELVRERDDLMKEIEPRRRLRAEVAALPPSTVKLRGHGGG